MNRYSIAVKPERLSEVMLVLSRVKPFSAVFALRFREVILLSSASRYCRAVQLARLRDVRLQPLASM